MKFHLLSFALVVSACASKKEQPAPKPEQSNASDTCAADVSALRTWLRTVSKEGGHVGAEAETDPEFDLVLTDAKLVAHSAPAVSVSLSPTIVMVEGSPVSTGLDADKLTSFLQALRAEIATRAATDFTTIQFFVDKKTPWKTIVGAADAGAAAGYTNIAFAFAGPAAKPTLTVPPASSMHKAILAFVKKLSERPDPAARQPALSAPVESQGPDFLLQAGANCAELITLYGTFDEATPDRRKSLLTDGVADAIQQCGCEVDLPALKEFYWYIMFGRLGAITPTKLATIRVVPADTEGAATLSAPGSASWQEVHGKLLELAKGDEPPNLTLKLE